MGGEPEVIENVQLRALNFLNNSFDSRLRFPNHARILRCEVINLTGIDGKWHIVNPLHITAIDESDAGCIVHLRGRDSVPIVIPDTVEVMAGALNSWQMEPSFAESH
jgi:uncharacterized protein YlzI (FlbEa/FlbD family)